MPKDVVYFVNADEDYDELNRNTLLSSNNKVNSPVVIDGSKLLANLMSYVVYVMEFN